MVGLLTRELRRQGHDVVLFASAASDLATHRCAPSSWAADLGGPSEAWREVTYAARVLDTLHSAPAFDVVHDHCGGAMLIGALQWAGAPVVHTVHGVLGEPEETCYADLDSRAALVAISYAQRRSAETVGWFATVHNPIDVDGLWQANAADKQPYLLCLARICPDKGQHLALEVARRAGRPLVLAGKVDAGPEGAEYYERWIAPAIDGSRVIHLHDVAGEQKGRLLANATALLAPLQWEEPFGLAMAEAMASGTPVVAFARGAAPEVVTPGVTGFLVNDVDGMVQALGEVDAIDPARCAAEARARFAPARAAAEYLAVYERVREAEAARGAGRSVAGAA